MYLRTKGVTSTAVGYMGGTMENPTYEDVCTDRTGHAEVVQVQFDPSKISYDDLLTIFFENHNPTTRDAQGPDIGHQYRSVIFTHSPAQQKSAEAFKEKLELAKAFPHPIVTEIVPATTFYRAEEYHQQYLRKRGLDSCHL